MPTINSKKDLSTKKKKLGAPSQDIEDNNTVAAIGYIWALCLIPLLLKKDSKFAQFHGKQGLVLFIIEIALGWIPVIGQIVFVAAVIVSVIGFIKAVYGEYWEIPVLGKYAKNIHL